MNNLEKRVVRKHIESGQHILTNTDNMSDIVQYLSSSEEIKPFSQGEAIILATDLERDLQRLLKFQEETIALLKDLLENH